MLGGLSPLAIRKLQSPRAARRYIRSPLPMLVSTLMGVIFISCGLNAHAAIPQSERDVLIALYTVSNGGGWTNNTNWCSTAVCPATGTPSFNATGTECTWFGITCDATSTHVTAINLGDNGLGGAGPLPDLAALAQLSVFDVHTNLLSGSIPALGGMTSLTYFDVSSNRLTGSLPTLDSLFSLVYFNAFGNQLTGSIPALAGLTALQYFGVDSNELSGQIPALAGLTSLQEFVADSNGIGLSGPIPDLTGLANLQSFVVFGNGLTGTIPTNLATLTALENFAVNGNFLSGSIPSLAGLGNLVNFVANGNLLTGPIPPLTGLNQLAIFKVDTNSLSGPIPVAPASLSPGESTLCPNLLDIGPSPNDAGWEAATGITPWWGGGNGSGCNDVIFDNGFELP